MRWRLIRKLLPEERKSSIDPFLRENRCETKTTCLEVNCRLVIVVVGLRHFCYTRDWVASRKLRAERLEGCGFHSEGGPVRVVFFFWKPQDTVTSWFWFRFWFSLYAWPSNITYTLLFTQDKSSTFSSREKQSVGYTLLSAGRLWVPFQRWHILVGFFFFFFSQPQEDTLQLFTLCTWQRQAVKTHRGLTVSASTRMQ